jgi:hypothetical protein
MIFHRFWYELTPDPTVEGIRAQSAITQGSLPRELWPDVEVGIRMGYEDAIRGGPGARGGWEDEFSSGVRFCSLRFTMTFAMYHDVETTPHAVQVNVSRCVNYDLARQCEPVPPLHKDWFTSDVIALAHGIHANSALDGLPALYDALLEAGCDDPLVMEHLQTCLDHSPSCWVTEMIVDQAARRG